jgi:hypothetical protein
MCDLPSWLAAQLRSSIASGNGTIDLPFFLATQKNTKAPSPATLINRCERNAKPDIRMKPIAGFPGKPLVSCGDFRRDAA